MLDVSLDRDDYQRLPTQTAEQTAAMGLAVVTALPPDLRDPLVAKRHRNVAEATQALQLALGAGDPNGELSMPFNLREDAAVGSLRKGIDFLMSLPVGSPRQVAGARLNALLLPSGTAFLKKDGRTQWVKVDEVTRKLAQPDVRAEVTRLLGGDDVLVELDTAHAEHGRVLGITVPLSPAEAAKVQPAQKALRKALTDYAFQVLATVDDDSRESRDVAMRALLPFETARTTAAEGRSGGAKEADTTETTTTETPATPIAPAANA